MEEPDQTHLCGERGGLLKASGMDETCVVAIKGTGLEERYSKFGRMSIEGGQKRKSRLNFHRDGIHNNSGQKAAEFPAFEDSAHVQDSTQQQEPFRLSELSGM